MTNWLERARREIAENADQATANSDVRNPSSVTAVPQPGESEISTASIVSNGSAAFAGMTEKEESTIRAWLAHIGETDTATIAEVLDKCGTDTKARQDLIRWIEKTRPQPVTFEDDRRRCDQCANLTGRGHCLAAWRGEIAVTRLYEPVRDLLHRCPGYLPKAAETDQRPGRERWPGLIQQGSNHAND